MDESRVAAIAARHRALQSAAHTEGILDDRAAAERLRQQIDACWQQLGEECAAFCEAYNRSFGSDRLSCQRHADTIVVRSVNDSQETVTLSRTSLTHPHGGRLSAHRYSPHAAPVDLSIEGHVDGNSFTLTNAGQPITPEETALILLERFTEELLDLGASHRSGRGPES
jgi:hypothetical protein